ncbi:hypothetical protein [Megasphaera elsdenii]|uniref:hypothetical protein n=1 Tax=Megasphaera elsdenii TaxID=907 RepID=UPI00242FC8C4|nr:hypothetical protein [Megasphaera elsdenii]
MIDDKMAKMAVNTLITYCDGKKCADCAVSRSCKLSNGKFKYFDSYPLVGVFENLQKSPKRPIKFDEKMKESKAFIAYLWALLEEVTETTIGDYDRLHMKIDVNKYGKVTIDLKNNNGRVVAHGYAKCHPNDTFNLKTGVKIAAERMIEELKKPLHPRNDDVYYCIGDYGPVQRICKDEFIDRLNDVIGNCFNNPAVALEHETEIRYRKENILRIIADYMKKE